MRIIAGTHRGRRVEAPPGQGTRPMLDRVREAMFATLAPWMDGARVLDLFAGSGSLAFEALSRGAALARLVERDPKAVVTAGRNAELLDLMERVQLTCADALDPSLWGSSIPEQALVELDYARSPPAAAVAGWDVCLCDPPYPLLGDPATRSAVLAAVKAIAREHLAPEGILVLHAPARALDEPELAEEDLSLARRTYGSNAIWYVQRVEVEDTE